MVRLFTDDEQNKRFDNHEVMMRDYGRTLSQNVNYVFKLESRVRELERKQEVLIDLVKKIGEKIQ